MTLHGIMERLQRSAEYALPCYSFIGSSVRRHGSFPRRSHCCDIPFEEALPFWIRLIHQAFLQGAFCLRRLDPAEDMNCEHALFFGAVLKNVDHVWNGRIANLCERSSSGIIL
jgi:hypothetical protein